LKNTDLNLANLRSAKLHDGKLAEVSFLGAHLEFANLSKADLSYARYFSAYLSHANFSYADLSYANLSNANSDWSVIIGVRLYALGGNDKGYPLCQNTRFNDLTIIDNEELWRHFHNNTTMNVLPPAKEKRELREKLKQRGFDEQAIYMYLSFSSLPESPTQL
jgi:hypothetical protein